MDRLLWWKQRYDFIIVNVLNSHHTVSFLIRVNIFAADFMAFSNYILSRKEANVFASFNPVIQMLTGIPE